MALKRASTLRLLNRIKQNEIDDLASRLSTVRSQIQNIDDELQALQDRVNSEGTASQPEFVAYLANFLKAIELRRSTLTAQRVVLERDEGQLEEQLLQIYSEAQVGKAALDSLEAKQSAEANAKETAFLDELALITHRRAGA